MFWSKMTRTSGRRAEGAEREGRRRRAVQVESLERRDLMAGGFGDPVAGPPNRLTSDQMFERWKGDWHRTQERIAFGAARTAATFSGVGRLAPAAWSALSGLQRFGTAANLGRNLFSTARDPMVRTTPLDYARRARDWWTSAIGDESDGGFAGGFDGGFDDNPFGRWDPAGWMDNSYESPWTGGDGDRPTSWEHPTFDNAIDYGNYWTDYVRGNR